MAKMLEKLCNKKNNNSNTKIFNIIKENNISVLRKKAKILLVDDEKFPIVDVLKQRDYNIYYKKDITYVIESEPFDIVILDIVGVGKELGGTREGFSIALEIKKYYPAKIVMCYSGNNISDIAEDLKLIDDYIKKDNSVDKWCEKLDIHISNYCSIDYHWERIFNVLPNDLSQKDVDRIKKIYYDCFENEKLDDLNINLMGILKNVQLVLNIAESIIKVFLFFT